METYENRVIPFKEYLRVCKKFCVNGKSNHD